jgi:hypothetical protein
MSHKDSLVLPKGTLIRPAEIGGLMALGLTSIRVVRKVRVGLISTGDEVIDPGQTPRPGQVRDINRTRSPRWSTKTEACRSAMGSSATSLSVEGGGGEGAVRM